MAKTRYRKQTRRLRTRKYKRGGAPTAEQISSRTYSRRHWNFRPAALDIHKSPSSSEKRRNREERMKQEEEREEKKEKKEKKGLFQSMSEWRKKRKELSDNFLQKNKK